MKRIWVAGVLIVLALWLGSSFGYHFGRQNERAAWKATGVFVVDRKDAPPVIRSASSFRGDLSRFATDDSRSALHLYYRNPHSGVFLDSVPVAMQNVPDPRSVPVKDH
jgi:hypothetical protein